MFLVFSLPVSERNPNFIEMARVPLLALVLAWSVGRALPHARLVRARPELPRLDAASKQEQGEESLIGWGGNTYRPAHPKIWQQHVSDKPRAYVLHNLISDAEAQHIVDLAWPQMKRSTVVGPNNTDVLDDYRTSYGTFISRYQTPVVARIQDRVALLTRAPVVHQEDMQVLRYGVGQYYHQHTDSLENDSPRMATLLMYLADPEEGGETSFPLDGSEWADPRLQDMYEPTFSECAKGHVAFKPRRGDALLFWSIHPDGHSEDMLSMHEGCPVVKGAKWTTTFWIHTVPFRPNEYRDGTFMRNVDPFIDPGMCVDKHAECKKWAEKGECTKNPVFMAGFGTGPGERRPGGCMAACKACELCTEADRQRGSECYWENRRKLNYLVFEPEELKFRRTE